MQLFLSAHCAQIVRISLRHIYGVFKIRNLKRGARNINEVMCIIRKAWSSLINQPCGAKLCEAGVQFEYNVFYDTESNMQF